MFAKAVFDVAATFGAEKLFQTLDDFSGEWGETVGSGNIRDESESMANVCLAEPCTVSAGHLRRIRQSTYSLHRASTGDFRHATYAHDETQEHASRLSHFGR